MTVEFVEDPDTDPVPVPPRSPRPVVRRLPAALLWLSAAALFAVAPFLPLTGYRQTTFIPDFDHTDERRMTVTFDGFGHTSISPSDPGLVVDGEHLGVLLLATAVLVLVAAVWAVLARRGAGPAFLATAGLSVGCGVLGTAAVQAFDIDSNPAPQFALAGLVGAGFWLAVAGVAVALVGVLTATGAAAGLGSTLRRRRRAIVPATDRHRGDPGPDDIGPADVDPVDVGHADVGPVDVGPNDVGREDTSDVDLIDVVRPGARGRRHGRPDR